MKNISDDELMDDVYFDWLINYVVGIGTFGEVNVEETCLRDNPFQLISNYSVR
jgi:hypothetical protein